MTIDDIYEQNCKKKCDINEHLPTLKKYASESKHVTEFGVRFGISTSALLSGKPKVLKSYDINKKSFKKNKLYRSLIKDTSFTFTVANVLEIEIEDTDMLFIDTWHTYNQLSQELRLHANKVRKHILFHDTVTFGNIGEDKTKPGLLAAINEFLDKNKCWSTTKVFKNNNGLYIISRK